MCFALSLSEAECPIMHFENQMIFSYHVLVKNVDVALQYEHGQDNA